MVLTANYCRKGTTWLIVLLVVGVPFVRFDSIFISTEYSAVVYTCLLMIVALPLCLICTGRGGPYLFLTQTDLFILGYVFFMLIHAWMIKPMQNIDNLFIIENMSPVILYFAFKTIAVKQRFLVYYGVFFSGLIQSLIVLAQFSGLLPSHHEFFRATGSFGNPGVCAWHIALSVAIGFHLALKKRRFLFFPLALMAIALIVLNSRAAWLAALISIMVCLLFYYRRPVSDFLRSKKLATQLFFFIVLASLTIKGSLLLYEYKKDSVDGRFFIWRISTQLWGENLYTGVGINQFATAYLPAQANYFMDHPDVSIRWLADNTVYAFNDLLEIGCEQGIPGFSLFLALLIFLMCTIVRGSNSNNEVALAGCGLLICLVIALVGYPLSVFQIKLYVTLMVSVVSIHSRIIPLKWPGLRKFSIVLILIYVLYIYQLVKVVDDLVRCEKIHRQAGKDVRSYKDCEKLYSHMKNNPWFLQLYANILMAGGKNSEACFVLNRLAHLFPNSHSIVKLGICYKLCGEFDLAGKCFVYSKAMVPNRVLPDYELAKMHFETGKYSQAIAVAEKVVDQPQAKLTLEGYSLMLALKEIMQKSKKALTTQNKFGK